jgi:hypothetical protein
VVQRIVALVGVTSVTCTLLIAGGTPSVPSADKIGVTQ